MVVSQNPEMTVKGAFWLHASHLAVTLGSPSFMPHTVDHILGYVGRAVLQCRQTCVRGMICFACSPKPRSTARSKIFVKSSEGSRFIGVLSFRWFATRSVAVLKTSCDSRTCGGRVGDWGQREARRKPTIATSSRLSSWLCIGDQWTIR